MRCFNILILALALFCAQTPVFAAPHILEDNFYPEKHYVMDKLVKKEQVKVYVEPVTDKNMSVYYQEFFKNILQRLEDNPAIKEELKDIIDIIEFGASEQAYIFLPQNEEEKANADIKFLFTEKKEFCPGYSDACFSAYRKAIYLPSPDNNPIFFNRVTLHEVGHSLRLEDLHSQIILLKGGRYGSGKKKSIMLWADTLTCDDADGIINAVWLTKKNFDEKQPDFSFTSFCQADIKYKNAQQLNRNPWHIDQDGERMVYIYCKDGPVKSTTHIDPINGGNFYKFTEENRYCEAIMPQSYQIVPEEDINYTIKDFNTGEIIEEKKVNKLLSHNTYIPLPYSNGLTLNIAENKYDIPAYLTISDEEDNIVYMLAYLDNGYNIVYSYYLRGRINNINLNGTLFIYNRKNPAENYTYTAPKDETEQTKNNPLRQILDKYYTRLAKDHKIFLPRYSGWGAIKESYYLKGAEAWEEWLLKNSAALKMKNNKDLIGEVKQLKEELIPLPTIPLESFSYFNNKKK